MVHITRKEEEWWGKGKMDLHEGVHSWGAETKAKKITM